VGCEGALLTDVCAATHTALGTLQALVEEVRRKLAEEEDPATRQGLEVRRACAQVAVSE
jgi:hypothetical protein